MYWGLKQLHNYIGIIGIIFDERERRQIKLKLCIPASELKILVWAHNIFHDIFLIFKKYILLGGRLGGIVKRVKGQEV